MIEDIACNIPESLMERSGSVFYSGRNAFTGQKPLYILGVNPGGDPTGQAEETVAWHTSKVLTEEPDDWSAYRDESWLGAVPGTWGMQPRVLHLFKQIGCSAGAIPASNIVFVRSRREDQLKGSMNELAEACWQFHQTVIESLAPRVILCFGQTAGKFVCEKLGANVQIDEFIEANNRRWRSRSIENQLGQVVVVATHPARADWTNPVSDPTVLVQRALLREA